MSEVIDQRTVEMRFNNRDFERNVETSLGTIERLKKSLDFGKSADSLALFEKSLKDFNPDYLKKTADDLGSSFKDFFNQARKFHGIKQLDQAFTDLDNTIKQTIESMTQIKQIRAGWNKYAMKTTSVQTIMAATGKTIDEVSESLDRLNWYSDETSADFADMVNNIGKFTSSGIDLKDATSAMQGVFNWASVSGQGVQAASRAMYNLAQAISIGSVKMADWRSIELANMATQEFKQTVLDTGVQLGKLTQVGDKFYTTVGKKQEVSTKNFSSTLSTGWFDSELLTATLKRYSEFSDKVYDFIENHPDEGINTVKDAIDAMRAEAEASGEAFDELGYKWFISAQEAKTFTDAVNSVKDAVSTGWMNTFELIFGNYEQSRLMWTNLANDLYEIFAEPGNARNSFLEEVMTSAYHKLKKEVVAAGLSVSDFESQIYESVKANEAYKETLDDLIEKYGNFSNALDAGAVPTNWITDSFKILSTSGEELSGEVHTLEEVQEIVKDTFSGKYGNGQERFDAYKKLGYDAQAVQKLVSKFAKKGKLELSDLEEVGIKAGEAATMTWKDFLDTNESLVESLGELSGRELLIGSATNILKDAFSIITSVRDGIGEVFEVSPESVRNLLENIYKFTESLKFSEEGAQRLQEFVSALAQPIKSIGVVGKKFITKLFGDSLDNLFPKIREKFINTFDIMYTWHRRLAKVFKSLENSAYVNKAVTKISDGIRNFVSDSSTRLQEFKDRIRETLGKNSFVQAAKEFKNSFVKTWNEVNKNGGNAIDNVVKTFKKLWSEGELKISGQDSESLFSNLIPNVSQFITDFKNKFSLNELTEKLSPIGKKINEIFSNLFGGKQRGVKGSLPGGSGKQRVSKLNQFLEKYSNLQNNSLESLENVKNVIEKNTNLPEVFEKAKDGLQNFWGWAKPLLKTIAENFSKDLNPKSLTALIQSIATLKLSQIGKELGKGINGFFKEITPALKGFSLTKTIKDTIPDFKNAITEVADSFTTIKEQKQNIKAKSILAFAAAIGLVAGAMYLISQIPEDKLGTAAIVVGAIAGVLIAISVAMSKINEIKFEVGGTTVSKLIGIAATLLIASWAMKNIAGACVKLTEAVKAIAGLGWNKDTLAGVLGVLGLIGGLVGGAAAIGALTNPLAALNMIGSAFAILALAGAVRIIVSAVKEFAVISKNRDEFARSITAIIGLIATLGASVALAGLGPANIFGGTALAILAMAAAIRIMVGAVKEFAGIKEEDLNKSVQAIGNLLGSLSSAVFKIGWSFASIGKALTVFAFVGAIYALRDAVKELAEMPTDKLNKSINAISEMLSSLAGAVQRSGFTFGSFAKAGMVLAFGYSVKMIVEAMSTLFDLAEDPKRFETARQTITDIIRILGTWTALMGVANGLSKHGSTVQQALVIAALGYSIKMIADSMVELGQMNAERLKSAEIAVAIIGVVLGGITAVLGLIGTEKINGLGGAATLVGFATAVKTIADALVKLSYIPEDKLQKGGFAVGQIIILLTAVSIALSKFPVAGNFKQAGLTFTAIGIALAIIAKVIEQLGGLDEGVLKKGGLTVAAMMTALSFMAYFVSAATRMASWNGAAMLIAQSFSIWLLAQAFVKIAEVPSSEIKKSAIMLAAMVGALVLISKVTAAANDIKSAAALLILAGAVSVLALVAKTFADMEWEQLGKVGAGIGAMVVAMAAIAKFVNIGVKSISLLAVGKIGLIVAMIGGILAVLGGLYNLPGVSDWMESGGDFLGSIGKAIGKFFGGIAAGFNEGLAESIPVMGSALAKFAENSKPFFELLDTFKGLDVVGSIASLMQALDTAMWDTLWGKILHIFSKDENGKPSLEAMEAFGNGLAAMAPGMNTFLEALDGKETKNIEPIVNALMNLSKIAVDQAGLGQTFDPSTGMYKENADNPLITFADNIKEASGHISEAITALNTVPLPNGNAEKAIQELERMASVNTGSGLDKGKFDIKTGFFSIYIEWGQTLEGLASDMEAATGHIQAFIEACNGITFDSKSYYGGKLKASMVVDVLTQFAGIKIPQDSGFFNWFSNNKDSLTKFAQDMESMIGPLGTFVSTINNDENFKDLDMTKINAVVGIIRDMAGISFPGQTTDTDGNGINVLTRAGIDVTEMVIQYQEAAKQLNNLAALIDESKLTSVRRLFMFFNGSYKVNKDFTEGVVEAIKTLIEGINGAGEIDSNVASTITSISNILDIFKANVDVTGAFTQIGNDIAGMINTIANPEDDGNLKKAREVTDYIASFMRYLSRIANNFSSEAFTNNFDAAIEAINTSYAKLKDTPTARRTMKDIVGLFTAIQELYKLNFSAEDDTGVNKISEAFGAISDAIENFAPKTGLEDFVAYVDFIKGLAGQGDIFEKAGNALNKFVVDPEKMNLVKEFIQALKGEFIFSPSAYNFDETRPGSGVYEWTMIDGYFQKIADDLVAASGKLKDGDFEEFSLWTGKLSQFAISLHKIASGINKVKFGDSLVQFIKSINEAVLGDGTEENPGLSPDVATRLDSLSALDSLMEQIKSYRDDNLSSVIPDILNNISAAISGFTYDQTGLDNFGKAVQGIVDALQPLMNPNFTPGGGGLGPRGGLLENLTGRVRISKLDQFKEKYQNTNSGDANGNSAVNDLISSLDNLDLDKEKADTIMNIAETLAKAADGVVEANPGSFSNFVQSIADSVVANADKVIDAATALVEVIASVFEASYGRFFGIGKEIVASLALGMVSGLSIAKGAAASICANILNTFETVGIDKARDTGTQFINELIAGLNSEENRAAVEKAINNLFGGNAEEEGEGQLQDDGEGGLQSDTGMPEGTNGSPGARFAQQFINDFNQTIQESDIATGLIDTLNGQFTGLSTSLQEGAQAFDLSGFSEAISAEIGETKDEIQGPIGELRDVMFSIFPDGYGMVIAMMDGMILAFQNEEKIAEVVAAAAAFANRVKAALQGAFSINSPSKFTMHLGEYLMEGFVVGIDNDEHLVLHRAMEFGDHVKSAFSGLNNVSFDPVPFKKTSDKFGEIIDSLTSDIEDSPVIRPVLDLDDVKSKTAELDSYFSREKAYDVSASINEANQKSKQNDQPEPSATYNFTQNNYSPKSLSRAEIYRQTKNQFAMLKGANA